MNTLHSASQIGMLPRLWLLVLLALTAGCAQTTVATPTPVVLEIAGATSMRPVLQALAREFTARHPSVLIDLRGGGSALGEERVREGRLELAASTLMPEDANDEAAAPAENASLLRAPIGVDAVAVIVHASNPVADLTTQQLRDIFNGRILNWQELAGGQSDIVLVSREEGSGTRQAFESRVMDEKPVSLTAVVMPTSADVVDYVSKNPYSIGYVSSAYVTIPPASFSPNATAASSSGPDDSNVRVIAVDGVLASDKTIEDQSYPLVQPLYLVMRRDQQGWPRRFIDFALSPAGQAIVDRYHAPVR